ncbi:ATP-binding protein [Amycolatopsis sp. NBC_00355]|uniref:AAA family ATPase n=1 Tax=Amycolatopsis sp. NBC_00355 TaxID=2975957 RepID=UPI002E260E63
MRDLVELSLAAPNLRGNVPTEGNWVTSTTRVAGIYGANASGKSTVLHALDFMTSAIQRSATTWADSDTFPHHPYLLDKHYEEVPSLYEIDVVVDDIRYTYGFESNASGIKNEWLYSYHSPWKRMLFDRTESAIKFGRSLSGENQLISKLMGPRNLFLSVASNSQHPTLRRIHHRITRHIRYARYTDSDRSNRVKWVQGLIKNESLWAQAQALIKLADLGIANVKVEEVELDEETKESTEKVIKALQENIGFPTREKGLDDFWAQLSRKIVFEHDVEGSEEPAALDLALESSGTVAWLSLGVPALYALKYGDTYLVDELDSSLHPRLTAALVLMFKDPEINRFGAQLIFTSHDVSLLGRMLGEVLSPEEVWFIEKNNGVSEIYALHEFQVRKSDNFEKRYLEGRYGAVPMIRQDDLRKALLEGAGK